MKPTVTEADGWSREDAALFAFVATERIRYLFKRRKCPASRAALRLQLAALCNAKHLLSSSSVAIAVPELIKVLAGCADALREAGKDFAQANRLAVRPNLYELHERSARAAIAKAKGGAE